MPEAHTIPGDRPTAVPPDQTLAPEMHITRLGATVATILGVVGAALLALVDQLAGLDATTKIGALGLLAVALAAITAMIVTDVRGRTEVKVAQIEAAAHRVDPPASLVSCSATSLTMAVQISGDRERYGVLALRQDGHGATWYLVGRKGQRPKWVHNDQVADTFYDVDPSAYDAVLGGAVAGNALSNGAGKEARGKAMR